MRGDRSHGDRTHSAVDALARAVPALLRSSRAAARPADVRARRVQRQRPQVDAGDAGAGHRAGLVSSVSAFHHACAVGCGSDLASAVGNPARAPRRADHRRHQLSETGAALGRRRPPVLRCAGQDRELPSRGDRGAVDGHTRVVAGRVAVSAAILERRMPTRRAAARIPSTVVVSGEMAARPHVDSPRARGGAATHGRRRGRRVRGYHGVPACCCISGDCPMRSASRASSRYFAARRPCIFRRSSAHGTTAIAAGARARHPADHRAGGGVGAAGASVAPRDLAQWHQPSVGGAVRGRCA